MEQTKRLTLGDTLATIPASWHDALRQGGIERLIGQKLLNYVGMLLIVLGGAFFLKYTHGLAGPTGKLAIGLCSGLALVTLGEFLNRRPDRQAFSLPLIGGGWILVYYTVFAAHYLTASCLIASSGLEMLLLCITAAGMIGHSLNTRSRLLTVFAFGTAYFVFAITHLGVQTLTVCTVLALAGACLVGPLDSPELAAVNLAGFYMNYFPVFKGFLAVASGQAIGVPLDFWHSLAAAAIVHSAYALLTPMHKNEQPDRWVDGALSFSAILYAVTFYSQVRAFEPACTAAALLTLSAVLTGLATLRRGVADTALTTVQAFLGATLLALGVFALPNTAERAWGLALAPSVLGTIGLWLNRKSFEKYGLALLGLGLLHGLFNFPLAAEARGAVALSLSYLGVSAYAFALLRRTQNEGSLTGLWAYGGLSAFILGAWTFLPSAAFVCSLFALGSLLEWGASQFEDDGLLKQAILVETAAGLACFCVDYASNHPVLGVLSPSRLVSASAVLCYASAIFGRALPEGQLLGLDFAGWRGAQSWLMSAAAGYGFSQESAPLLRLPLLGGSALALLAAGRSRLPQAQPVAGGLRLQAYVFLLAAAGAGVWSYLLFPPVISSMSPSLATFLYWDTAIVLLLPLAWQSWAKTEAERTEEVGSQYLFSLMSLALPAFYVAKLADGAHMTLAWTALASAYLVGGLLTRRQALRLPGLGLAGLCVGKALFVDLTCLELPYRVLSYTLLGAALVGSSYLYVRLTGKEDSDAI